jgi:hypothetical protein
VPLREKEKLPDNFAFALSNPDEEHPFCTPELAQSVWEYLSK